MSLINISNEHLLMAFVEFENKCQEIERFLGFVDDLDSGKDNLLKFKDNLNNTQEKPISREVQKTLRASCYLLIYNLLESTTCDALDAIHLTLLSEDVDLQELSNNLKKVVFNNLKNGLGERSITDIINNQVDVRSTILSHGYNKTNFLSGNFDIDAIKKIEKKYGFNLHIVNGQQGTYDKEKINTIKNKRNALAHGSQSFEQCGQNIPLFTMNDKYTHAKNVLLALFNGLNNYIKDKKYLNSL